MIPAPSQYTDLDFDRLRARLLELATSAWPDWDPEVASLGTLLLELLAYVGDVLSFRQEQLLREARITTATERRSLAAAAALLGERLLPGAAATVEIGLALPRPWPVDVVLAAGTRLRPEDASAVVRFSLLADATIRAGQDPPEVAVVAEHSEPQAVALATAGAPGLAVALERTPYLDGSLVAATPQGAFTVVEHWLGSGPQDRHVVVEVDADGRVVLRFGDGRQGLAPLGLLTMRYKTGGGAVGNVAAGTLAAVDGTVVDAAGRPVPVRVTQAGRASGGVERETVAQARRRLPLVTRAPARTVAREDFEIHARQVPGVARALMLTSDEDPSIDENRGILYVVPHGGGAPTPALKGEVRRQVTVVYPCTLTFQVAVQDPVYRAVDVAARVALVPGARADVVARAVRERLAAFFALTLPDGTANPQIDFGHGLRADAGIPDGELAWSRLADVVIDTPGVRKLSDGRLGLLLNGLPADVRLAPRELPVLGTVTIRRAETGEVL